MKRGFTLIELLVVIVIIGILTTIGIGTFNGYQARARDIERISNLSHIKKFIDIELTEQQETLQSGTSGINLSNLLSKNGFNIPKAKNGIGYVYVAGSGEQNYGIYTWGESQNVTGENDEGVLVFGSLGIQDAISPLTPTITRQMFEYGDSGTDTTELTNFLENILDPSSLGTNGTVWMIYGNGQIQDISGVLF